MKRLLIIILAAAALCGCEMDFTVSATAEAKLYLQCTPGVCDTTIIQLYRTVPVGTVYSGSKFLEDADVTFRVNNVPRDVKYAAEKTGSVMPGCRYVVEKVNPGDVIEITASAEGVKSVSASTRVPDLFPEYKLTDTGKYLKVDFHDDPATEDRYGMMIIAERTLVSAEHGTFVQTRGLTPIDDSDGGILALVATEAKNYIDVSFCGWAFGDYYNIVRIWSDENSNGKDMSLALQFGNAYFETPGYRDAQGRWRSVQGEETIRYKLKLYRFTKEFHNWALAQDNIANNSFAELGVAPAAFAYTNVTDGVGIFAGCSMVETDWL